jgi:hypothetical protein
MFGGWTCPVYGYRFSGEYFNWYVLDFDMGMHGHFQHDTMFGVGR